MPKVSARRNIENSLHRYGFVAVAGVDEVGRGCLAGPVMAGAVILHPDRRIDGLADSKACTAAQRERLHDEICRKCVSWAVVSVDPDEIDRINIHQATLQAMRRAVLVAGAAARCSFGRCLSNSVIADGPARRDWRRSPGVRHSGGVDRGQSDAGSIDAGAARR